MDETAEDFNDEYSLNTDLDLSLTASFHEEQPSSSNSVPKQRKSAENNCVPWRFCLSQLQRCKDQKNRAQFKKLISKYSQTHFQQRRTDTLSKARQIWPDLEERYGDVSENWLNIEADLFAREGFPFAFVNILVKADPSTGLPCRATRRINGVCRGHPEHNVKEVSDPRTRLKRMPRTVPLLIPKYEMDDYIAFAPPRREIAFLDLNDNVKEEYLREFCCAKGRRELVFLQIYNNPTTGGHLGMALAEFKTTDQAMDFFKQYGVNTKIMGFPSKIFVDTLGFWITDEIERLTGNEPTILPPRRSFFKKPEEIVRIRELIRLQNIKDDVYDNRDRSGAMSPQEEEEDLNVSKPSGARTPLGLPNSSSASANSLSRSNSRESMESVEENEPKKRNGRSPVNSAPNSLVNGHSKRNRSRSPSRSRYSKDYRHHNGHSRNSSRYRDDYESRHYRDRTHGTKRRYDSREDRRTTKYRRRDFSISPDRTRSSHRRKRSVSSSSTRSGSSDSYKHHRSKRTHRERSASKTRKTESRNDKVSEISQPSVDSINLCVQPPPPPFDLSLPLMSSYPPPFFPFYAAPIPPPPPQNYVDSIPTIPEDAQVKIKNVERELGPYYVVGQKDLLELLRQMRLSGYYNQSGIFVVPTLRLYEEPVCSFLVTDFFVELEDPSVLAPINPHLAEIEQMKEKLKQDMLMSLKANICQKIETLMYTEVDRLHVEYEAKQKILDEERSKMKKTETKQIFDFEEQFSNAGMGTKSVFGSNRMWQLNRNILSTKKIPKKHTEDANAKVSKDSSHHHHHRRKSTDSKIIKKESKKLEEKSRSSSYKSPSPAVRSRSRSSSITLIKKSPRSPSASSISSSDSSSSSSNLSSDSSDNEEEAVKKKISTEISQSSATSSQVTSRNVSPKRIKHEKVNDIESLQITQSRTLRKVDYYEDSSSDADSAVSDWAEEHGVQKDDRKKHDKKHKRKEILSKSGSPSSSDEEAQQQPSEKPKKEKKLKTTIVKEESPKLVVENDVQIKRERVDEPSTVKGPKTPPMLDDDDDEESEIVEPVTIKQEIVSSVEEQPRKEIVAPKLEKVHEIKAPRIEKPKLFTLPPQKSHLQLYPDVKFNARSNEEEYRILFDYADEEDSNFIMLAAQNKKMSITQLSSDEQIKRPVVFINPFTSNNDQPAIPPSPKISKSGNQRRNSAFLDQPCIGAPEGCARLMPYVKGRQKTTDKLAAINYGFIKVTEKDEKAARNKQEKRRELRALQRNLVSTVGDCSIVRQNVFKFREKMLKFARSSIHGWGLFTLEPIQPNDMIIEYVGETIRPTVADVREFNYTRRGIGSSYLFRMDDDSVVDATGKGNVARFINHSCNPNCIARVIGKSAQERAICIYAKRFIERGEEIVYDYQFPIEDVKIPCHCGSAMCRQYLN